MIKSSIRRKNIGIILQLRNSKVPKKLLDDFKELIKWLSIYYQANIIIRPHPRDREDYYNLNELIKDRNITIHHPDNYTIGQTLRKCSIIIAKYSSTIIESASIGVIPIIFNNFLVHEKKISNLNRFKPKLITGSIKQAKRTINILYNNDTRRNSLRKKNN